MEHFLHLILLWGLLSCISNSSGLEDPQNGIIGGETGVDGDDGQPDEEGPYDWRSYDGQSDEERSYDWRSYDGQPDEEGPYDWRSYDGQSDKESAVWGQDDGQSDEESAVWGQDDGQSDEESAVWGQGQYGQGPYGWQREPYGDDDRSSSSAAAATASSSGGERDEGSSSSSAAAASSSGGGQGQYGQEPYDGPGGPYRGGQDSNSSPYTGSDSTYDSGISQRTDFLNLLRLLGINDINGDSSVEIVMRNEGIFRELQDRGYDVNYIAQRVRFQTIRNLLLIVRPYGQIELRRLIISIFTMLLYKFFENEAFANIFLYLSYRYFLLSVGCPPNLLDTLLRLLCRLSQ